MNKPTELMIDHMTYGALFPKCVNYMLKYRTGWCGIYLDKLYDDFISMINEDFKPNEQPVLIDLVDLIFDNLDQEKIEDAVLEQYENTRED